jgi:2',3'-cyclic-nucleotide 2'-phosphodiesterase (5'-nucleotidase family)
MKQHFAYFVTLSFVIFFFSYCKTSWQPNAVTYKDYRVTNGNKTDSAMVQLLQPYADSVNKSMNSIVAVAASELEKKQPDGALGNMMADALFTTATQLYKTPVDAAFVNNGGIRLNSIAAGNITRGKIFELAPFDNVIVLLKLSGKTLQEFLNHISERGGWPAAGITWQIKNKQAILVMINGLPIEETATYTIAVTDFVANGGDDCNMLRPIPQINNGYLFRDAVLAYLTNINKQGKKVEATTIPRVMYAE